MEERFWLNVEKTGGGCWLWKGARPNGYGVIRNDGKFFKAHRFSYELAFGSIPVGMEVHHICRNKLCVRPSHLKPMLKSDHRRLHFPRLSHCHRGHPYDEENTYTYARHSGRTPRQCRECQRIRHSKSQPRQNARRRELRARLAAVESPGDRV